MHKRTKDILISLLLVGVAVLCTVRWQAWFGMPEEPFWPYDTIDYRFSCPADEELVNTPCSNDSVLTLLVLGDIHSRLAAADYDTLAARVPDADAVMQVGDWLERGQHFYYQSLLREWTPCELSGLPVLATPGNHEYTKGLNKSLSEVWDQSFEHPHNGPVGVPGASYYTDQGPLRIISIDTNPLKRLVYLTRTLTWLHQLMDSAGDRYVVVMMHHPVVSVGKGRFNALIFCTFRYALGQADLVIAGHDHSYMRREPFVVLNTSGRTKRQRTNIHAEVMDTVPVYGVITVKTADYTSPMEFRLYRLDNGEILDSLYVHHD